MNRKFYFSFLAFALTLAATVAFVVGHSVRTRAAAPNAALNALPASDFVIAIDAQRALNETLPSILASNPTLLAKINSHLDEFEKKTGINPRSIESIAIGGRFNSSRPDVAHGVLIARGSFNSDALIDAAFTAASAKMQLQKEEQTYQGKKLFVIGPQRSSTNGAESKSDRMAVAALDANTIAIGDLQGVQAAIDASLGGNRVDDQLVQLATQTPNAVVGFSGKVPQNFTEKFGAPGNNPAAKYFASIREFYGSYAVNGTDAENMLALRTENADQARDISQAINALKTLSAVGMSQSTNNSSTPQNAFMTALNGMSVTAQDNEVRIAFKIPQASLAPFMHMH